jgi:hypothetical protein
MLLAIVAQVLYDYCLLKWVIELAEHGNNMTGYLEWFIGLSIGSGVLIMASNGCIFWYSYK